MELERGKWHEIRRSVLSKLRRRLEGMRRGYAFVTYKEERGVATGEAVPFDSFEECCAAAGAAVQAGAGGYAEVVRCRYEGRVWVPELQPVLWRCYAKLV